MGKKNKQSVCQPVGPRRLNSNLAQPRLLSSAPSKARQGRFEELEGRLHWSVSQDASGWTVVSPSSDSKVIYVSSSIGSDSNNGLSQSTPIKSFAKAQTLIRSGKPDEILLRAGDTFNDAFLNWTASGRSATEPMLVSLYQPDPANPAPRPLIYSGTATAGFQFRNYSYDGTTVNYVDVIGLQFDANLRDPTLPGNANPSHTVSGGNTGLYFYSNGGNLLVEDCSFSYYRLNFDIEALANSNSSSPFNAPSISNINIRRTVASYAYAPDSGRSQGLYAYAVNGLTITESDFDHNGWSEVTSLNAYDIGYNHNIYISSNTTNVDIENNIIAEASYAGIMARSGGIIKNNMFIYNAVAVSFGSADGADSTVGGVSGQLVGNTIVGDKGSQILTGSPLAFGQGFVIANTKPGANVLVADNVFTQDSQNAKPAITLTMATGTKNPAACVGLNDLTIQNNKFNGYRQGIQTDGRFVPGGSGLYALNNLKVLQNDYINSTLQQIRHDGGFTPSQETWSANRFYDSVLAQSKWITLQSVNTSFTTWKALYDLGAVLMSIIPYPNVNASVATYDATLGGPGTWQDFLAKARNLSITSYQPAYMATNSTNYIKAAFGVNASSIIFGPNTPPTAAAVAGTLNASAKGATSYTFAVNYTDGAVLNVSSLSSTNLLVSGPNGYNSYATYVSSATPTTDGAGYQHTTATYFITPPGGAWATGADGTYTITLLPNQVTDNVGNVASDATIGTFSVDFTPPTAVVTGPTITGGSPSTFTVTFSDAAGIDTSTLNSFELQVTGPGSYNRYAALSTFATQSNGNIVATYTLTTPVGGWSSASAYTISMLAGGVFDSSGNAVTAGTLGTFNFGTIATTSISGTVFNDANGNGTFDARENILSGVTIYADINGNGTYDPGTDLAATTDNTGAYTIPALAAGRYSLAEVAPSGFAVTSPSTGTNIVTVSTAPVTGVNFANQVSSTTSNSGGSSTSGGTSGRHRGRGR